MLLFTSDIYMYNLQVTFKISFSNNIKTPAKKLKYWPIIVDTTKFLLNAYLNIIVYYSHE